MPSTGSKLTLVTSAFIATGTIYYIHFKQSADRQELRKGIELEQERKQQRLLENKSHHSSSDQRK